MEGPEKIRKENQNDESGIEKILGKKINSKKGIKIEKWK